MRVRDANGGDGSHEGLLALPREVLEGVGSEVVVNGRHVQNVPGRKTDMADCQWLATLQAHGLLRGGLCRPPKSAG